MTLFIISGAIFLTGAIGFEMLSARHDSLYGINSITYKAYYTCEEFLEMLGIAIFIYALLRYLTSNCQSIRISINKDTQS